MPADPHDSDREKSRGTRRASQKWRTQYRAPPSSALRGRDQAVLRSVLETEGMHQALDHPVHRGRLEKTRAVTERGAENSRARRISLRASAWVRIGPADFVHRGAISRGTRVEFVPGSTRRRSPTAPRRPSRPWHPSLAV